jgi:zinc protease
MNASTNKTTCSSTTEFTLDNGLKVIVREDRRAPVVASQVWYKVGASYEPPGQTGLSHALEHMMFMGSKKVGPGKILPLLRKLGIKFNAFTSSDSTAFYQTLARDRLGVAFELEADRMANLLLPADEFAREIEVIKEERRQTTDDKPMDNAYERFKAMAYPASGTHSPTIGWMADLDRMKVKELRHWYRSWYAPNNATLVVVGDVTPDEVKALAQRYFGPIAKRDVPAAKRPLELARPGERQITLHVKTQVPSLMLAFNVPGIATAKNKRSVNALRLISALLADGHSARIPMQLQRNEELLSDGSSSYNAYTRGDSLFLLSATPNIHKNKTIGQAEAGLWSLLEQLKTTAPSTEELGRVRAQVIAELVYERDSTTRQATAIGRLETFGLSWKTMDTELSELECVTPEDIQKAAKQYFTRDRLSVAHILPMEPHEEDGDGDDLGVAHIQALETDKEDCNDSAASEVQDTANASQVLQSLAELDAKAPSHRTLDIQSWNTAEGAKVLFAETRGLPMFDIHLTFAAGSSRDGDTPGLARLTNLGLSGGVVGKDANTIAQGFESLGARYACDTELDTAQVSLRSLSARDKRDPALTLFAEVIGTPTFPDDSHVRLSNQTLGAFEDQKHDPSKLASLELINRLYGDHPYAHASDGTAQAISSVTQVQLRAFHQKAYAAGNAVIALVGDLSRTEAQAIAAQVSASLPKGPALAKIQQPLEPRAGISHIEFSSKQTILMLAQLGIDRDNPDYAALSMGNQILGGGFGTRLMNEVREKRGLTYGVTSTFTPMQARGPFMIKLKTRAEMSEGTLKLVQDVLTDYLKTGPTEKELDDAKRELAGSFPQSTASNSQIVSKLASIGFYNLPLNHLDDFMRQSQSLTVEQVKAAMNKHLSTDKLVIVSAGPTVVQKPLPAPTDKPAE